MKAKDNYTNKILTLFCTYNRLVGWEFLPDVEHKQHEPNVTKQLFAHGGPGNGAGRCIHTIPDEHVKMPVHLQREKQNN